VEFRIVGMFVIAHVQTISHAWYVDMVMILHRTKSRIQSFSSSLVIAIEPKDRYNFRVVAMLLFYILQQQKLTLIEVILFSNVYYHTQF
jgi:hypothetical protein